MLTILAFVAMRVTGDGELLNWFLVFTAVVDFMLIAIFEEHMKNRRNKP